MFIFWTDPPGPATAPFIIPVSRHFLRSILLTGCLFLVRDEELVTICSLLDSLHNNRLLLRKKEGGRRGGEETAANCFYRADFRQAAEGGEERSLSDLQWENESSCRVDLTLRSVFPPLPWGEVARPVPRSELAPACGTEVRTMASAVFEGTSLVNMFVRDCWVNGIRRLIISQRGEEEDFFEIRTEWSDRNILYLHRSYSDLGRLFKRLLESFPEDRRELSKSPLTEGRWQRS